MEIRTVNRFCFFAFIAGMLCGGFISQRDVNLAEDEVRRIKEQYRDCRMKGAYPSLNDMERE